MALHFSFPSRGTSTTDVEEGLSVGAARDRGWGATVRRGRNQFVTKSFDN